MRVVLVAGPPCAGKSTYVADHRGPDDVVIDFDAIAHALGYPADHVAWPADHHPARLVALRARASAIRGALEDRGHHTVWIVTTSLGHIIGVPDNAPRVVLDPGLMECVRRAANRTDPVAAAAEIHAWYEHNGYDAPSRTW